MFNGRTINLTNLNKMFWPEGLTKAHVIKYYSEMAEYVLPYILDRPFVMKRYPDGIKGKFFYQKDCPDYAPNWIKTAGIMHKSDSKKVDYIICNDAATLIWLANQGCIEIHTWLSKYNNLNKPDIALIDIDPPEGTDYKKTCSIALVFYEVLKKYGLKSFPKTSGSRGMHIFVPLKTAVYTYEKVTYFMEQVAHIVNKLLPHETTLERMIKKRGKKVYLDYLQNGKGKTIVFPYSLRSRIKAPVSTPLTWEEIKNNNIKPENYNINNIFQRLKIHGDIYNELLITKQKIPQKMF
jgi:bifunctional non-homologous end joining protein LigD